MTDELVLVDVADRVATITLNRPEARNALNGELIEGLRSRLGDCDADDSIDVMVLTGADPAFCAGLDLGYLSERAQRRAAGEDIFPTVPLGASAEPPTGKPVIGAVNGAAVTGGLEVALACDLLIASERARFADTHARVGIVPGWGLTVALPEAVGIRRAREMSATGNFVDAATALSWGLVNHVVPHDELLSFTHALAVDIASTDQVALRHLYATYRAEAALVDGPRFDLEWGRYREWQDASPDAGAAIAARRASVIERGRSQQG
ncbi:MAG: enoyl-CoA hydratase [Acidimicrobiia bacterium]